MIILDSFFNRQALQEYILLAGQHPAGGLRDKPPKYVRPFDNKMYLYSCFHAGVRMPTILRTVSPDCRLLSTVCILRLQGGRRCVRHGKVKKVYVLRSLPRPSAGQRKMVALKLSARLRTELCVILRL